MRIALITTTIHVPEVLRLYRACGPDVKFFIALDKKSPYDALAKFTMDGGELNSWLTPDWQQQYACSDLIGWNTIGRRSIALLEALKWGAEIIVTVDDDNIPMSTDYFDRYEMVLSAEGGFSGLKQSSRTGWHSTYGHLKHRGFPMCIEHDSSMGFAVDAKVGVAAGRCLGDPDIDATTRIANHPMIHAVGVVDQAGYVVDPATHTVFNSQNTAFIRELAPCFLMVPQFRRYDDIFASLIAQRVMRERNLHVHFGQPFVWQQRNPHDLLKDLDNELWGMKHVLEFSEWLDRFPLNEAPVLNFVRTIWEMSSNLDWMPAGVSELGAAWCDDIEKVL